MSSIKIQNLTVKTPVGAMKLPTGGFGDYAVTIDTLSNYILTSYTFNSSTISLMLADKINKIEQEDSVATTVEELRADLNLLLQKLR